MLFTIFSQLTKVSKLKDINAKETTNLQEPIFNSAIYERIFTYNTWIR